MYKDIVFFLNESEDRAEALTAAAKFANDMNAHLTGLYVRPSTFRQTPAYGMVTQEMLVELDEMEDVRAEKAKEDFLKALDRFNCSRTWREVSERENISHFTAYADLLMTNQHAYDPRRGRSNAGFINSLILGTGRPVILVPTELTTSNFGKNIVVGWDESKESVRAINDALPLLQKAEMVDVVSVSYEDDEVVDVSEISNFLSRRNVENRFNLQVTDEEFTTPEEVLLNYANTVDADLLVIGGYGHSRLREIILGGTTRYLTKYSDIPVFFSH